VADFDGDGRRDVFASADVDGDQFVDVLAQGDIVKDEVAVCRLEAEDRAATRWRKTVIGHVSKTFHGWHQWFGVAHANPAYEGRFRVNAPEISLHPTFGRRTETRENGMMLIKAEEDLFQLTAAEFYCEAWGGHPGTANRRITINGRSR
jgi:hypothetical protein